MRGIQFSSLKDGTVLELATCNSHYCIIRLATEYQWIQGGTRKDGTARYPDWSHIIILGSRYPGQNLRGGYIGKEMTLDFFDITRSRTITTSLIREISLIYSGCTFRI